ncbi:hypothetical protein Emag_002081 [Eimeria magna]
MENTRAKSLILPAGSPATRGLEGKCLHTEAVGLLVRLFGMQKGSSIISSRVADCSNDNNNSSSSSTSDVAAGGKISSFPTCLELLDRDLNSRGSISRVPFLFPTLDAALLGGLGGGPFLTEIRGPSGAGKTCLLLQLCSSYLAGVHLNLSSPHGGPLPPASRAPPEAPVYTARRPASRCAVYVDCDGGFRAERFLEIARGTMAKSSSSNSSSGSKAAESLLQRLVVMRVYSAVELQRLLDALQTPVLGGPHPLEIFLPSLCVPSRARAGQEGGAPGGASQGPPVGMIVVDSLGSVFHPALRGRGWESTKDILEMGFSLLQISAATKAVVVVASKTTAARAAAGRAWGHLPGLSLRLSGPPPHQPLSPLRQLDVGHCLSAAAAAAAVSPAAAAAAATALPSPLLLEVTAEGLREGRGPALPLY